MIERFKKMIEKAPELIPILQQEPPPQEVKISFCDPDSDKPYITVCKPKEGCECHCESLRRALNEEIERRGLPVIPGDAKTGCSGKCKNGPFVGFPQKEFFYVNVHVKDIPAIIEETLIKGRVLFPLLSVDPNRSYRPDIYYEKETGLLAAIHDQVCMVDVARYFLYFEEGLSCGKCVPCRLGMQRIYEDMDRIVTGQGSMENLEQIRILGETMIHTSHCAFAMTSIKPLLSIIEFFKDEFKVHIEQQECPYGVCQELVKLQKKKARRRTRKRAVSR